MCRDSVESGSGRSFLRCCFLTILLVMTSLDALGSIHIFTVERERTGSADAERQVIIDIDVLVSGADLCFFDSIHGDIKGCIALEPGESQVRTVDSLRLADGRNYGCFVRAHCVDGSGIIHSDTVFGTRAVFQSEVFFRIGSPGGRMGDDHPDSSRTGCAHNYPNPFNPREQNTKIVFEPEREGQVTMAIYDLFGHLVYEQGFADAAELSWSGRNGRSELVASGGYICILKMEGRTVSKHKIAVIK